MGDFEQVERNKLVIDLWNKGESGGRIVLLLNRKGYNLTRNAVSGIIHRHGQFRHAGPVRVIQRKAPPPRYNKQYKEKIPKLLEPEIPEPEAIGLADDIPEPGFCKYIKGDVVPGHKACGHATQGTKVPYCDWHLRYKLGSKKWLKESSPNPSLESSSEPSQLTAQAI